MGRSDFGAQPPSADLGTRLASLDAYRGLVMFLMMAEVLRLGKLGASFPDSPLCQMLAFHQSHVDWTGCSLHDLIQPSFSFIVGVAVPFSIANRRAKGQSFLVMLGHALFRAITLVCLGILLRSMGQNQTNYIFTDTLGQIGLGYTALFLLGLTRAWVHWLALGVILVGYWTGFVLYPLPPADFVYPGVADNWPHHATGLAAHFNKNSNLAWAFDTWFLNLFPRATPFTSNDGGYATLNFIPTLGTMILGLIAGTWAKHLSTQRAKLFGLYVLTGAVLLAAGWSLGHFGFCPVVKRIWTPSWTLFSGGWCFLFLAGFYLVLDIAQWRWWVFPLSVIGMNSIVAYCISGRCNELALRILKPHLGTVLFSRFGPEFEPLLTGLGILTLYWLLLLWLYHRKVFVRI